jgi:hypothetical protein
MRVDRHLTVHHEPFQSLPLCEHVAHCGVFGTHQGCIANRMSAAVSPGKAIAGRGDEICIPSENGTKTTRFTSAQGPRCVIALGDNESMFIFTALQYPGISDATLLRNVRAWNTSFPT